MSAVHFFGIRGGGDLFGLAPGFVKGLARATPGFGLWRERVPCTTHICMRGTRSRRPCNFLITTGTFGHRPGGHSASVTCNTHTHFRASNFLITHPEPKTFHVFYIHLKKKVGVAQDRFWVFGCERRAIETRTSANRKRKKRRSHLNTYIITESCFREGGSP